MDDHFEVWYNPELNELDVFIIAETLTIMDHRIESGWIYVGVYGDLK